MRPKNLILILIILFSSVIINRALAYDDKTTHPALTDEIVDFYNLNFGEKITEEEKEWIVLGSMLEDTPPRWINHFYDPIYDEGWTGEHGPLWVSEEILSKFSDVVLSTEGAVKTPRWARDQKLQAKYKNYQGNKTWQKALWEYIKSDDKKEAFIALGHILHLVEDMTVPDHTRNDTHPGDSPYENYASRFNRNNFQISDELQKQNYQPIIFDSLDEYFEYLAGYSNNYFFSKDTIADDKYERPEIIRDDGKYAYGRDKNNKEVLLAKLNVIKINDYKIYEYYDLQYKPSYYPILNSYFTRLSCEAILAGAGVINLFFKEAEEARKDLSLLEEPPHEQKGIVSLFGVMVKTTKDVKHFFVKVGRRVYDLGVNLKNAVFSLLGSPSFVFNPPEPKAEIEQQVSSSNNKKEEAQDTKKEVAVQNLSTQNPASKRLAGAASQEMGSQQLQNIRNISQSLKAAVQDLRTIQESLNGSQKQSKKEAISATQLVAKSPKLVESGFSITKEASEISPATLTVNSQSQAPSFDIPMGAGGGSIVTKLISDTSIEISGQKNEEEENNGSEIIMDPPIIQSPADFSEPFSTTTISFEGLASSTATTVLTINASYFLDSTTTKTIATSTVLENNNWSLELRFNEGTTTVDFWLSDSEGNVSSFTSLAVFIQPELADASPPEISSFEVLECGYSLSLEICLTATTTLHLSWSSNADDLVFYELGANGEISTTTGRAMIFDAEDGSQNSFTIRAKDQAGNWSATNTLDVRVETRPIVINEVGWAGTAASSYDEWLELLNTSDYELDLSKIVLAAQDGAPYINLSGSLAPKSYYLIERTDDTTISDISADLVAPFSGEGGSGLENGGEVLTLRYFVADATTTLDQTPVGSWPGGSPDNYTSMERIDAGLNGADPANWASNDTFIKNGVDADGNLLNGTPKSRNSASYHITEGNVLDYDKTLVATGNPYFVPNKLTIGPGVTLTIGSSTIIKFAPSAEIKIQGILNVSADPADPVVFTSFYDDFYGGDLNNGFSSTTPSRGDWSGISFYNSSTTSELSGFEIRYADTGLTYYNAEIFLSGGLFYENNLGVSFNGPPFLSVLASDLRFQNTPTSTPPNLFCGILDSMPWGDGDCVLIPQ
jgi:hypothetical protein